MKILHFVDTAGSDENFFKASAFCKVSVTNATSVICSFQNAGELAPDQIDITVTSGKADETALIMAEYMLEGSVGHGGILNFTAGAGRLTDASSIAYTAGA
jgi:hypothetical protein